jgi:hypothetical protein
LVDELTAVPDDFDEDATVAGRLSAHYRVLPAAAREFISAHPVESPDDDDEADDEPETEIVGEPGPELDLPETSEPETVADDTDFAFAMQMMHAHLTTTGRAAN